MQIPDRYKMQMQLPGMSKAAQDKLAAACVLVLELSGSAVMAAQFLCASGIGKLGLLDWQVLSSGHLLSPFFAGKDPGCKKTAVACEQFKAINPECAIACHEEKLDAHNAERIIGQYDLVIDGLYDWQAKLLASDTCMHLGLPMVHTDVRAFRFQVFTMVPGKSACLRCLLHQTGAEDLPAAKQPSGELASLCGMAGAMQACEAIELLTGLAVTGCDEMIQYDCLRREFDSIRGLGPRADCPDCGRQA